MTDQYAILLCGGAGTRLWPLSRSQKPKQLLALNGDLTLLQQTAERICQKVKPSNLFTVTHNSLKFEVLGQLAERYPESLANVIGEPVEKNTLPAIAIAVKRIHAIDPQAMIGVFASDHAIDDQEAFFGAWDSAQFTAEDGYLALLGIKPDAPISGYGYIKPGISLGYGTVAYPVVKVESFIEKPDIVTAKRYLKDGYLWNSGIFFFRADIFMGLIAQHQPKIAASILSMGDQPSLSEYQELDSISIDHAIVERAEMVAVVAVDMKWSDLGSWESIYQRQVKTAEGNVVKGNVVAEDSKNSLLWSDSGVVSTLGVDNLIVIRTADVTLVSHRSRAEDVKVLVNKIQLQFPSLTETHLTVKRPWGSYTVLEEGSGFKIKSILVNPNSKLSLQKHSYRSEHWVVVSGTATITNGEDFFVVNSNESTYIPSGNKHRLENNTDAPLIIIEVQTGSRLDEEDIFRFEDSYGRAIN